MSELSFIRNIYEDKPNIKNDIEKLKDWTEKQPHFPKIDKGYLVYFVDSCYYSGEKAKLALDNFLTIRTICPEMFQFRGFDEFKQAAAVTYVDVIPKKTDQNFDVTLLRFKDFNSENFKYNPTIKLIDYIFTAHLFDHGPSEGFIIILDANGFSFGHLVKINPVTMKKHFFYIQEAAPVRIKQIHIINANPIAEKLISIAKAFIKADIFQLIHLHKNIEGLFKFVPQRILPQEYGGEAPSIHDLQKQNLKDMEKYSDQFYYLNTLTVDESKRPGKPKTAGDLFGVDGTFKKLELD